MFMKLWRSRLTLALPGRLLCWSSPSTFRLWRLCYLMHAQQTLVSRQCFSSRLLLTRNHCARWSYSENQAATKASNEWLRCVLSSFTISPHYLILKDKNLPFNKCDSPLTFANKYVEMFHSNINSRKFSILSVL